MPPDASKGTVTVVTCARGPPQINGTATVMHELLRRFPLGSFVLLTRKPTPDLSKDDRTLPGATYEVASLSARTWHPVARLALLPFTLLSMALPVKRLGRPVRSVLAVFPSLDFLLASMLLSKLHRAPLFVYLHDCIVETSIGPVDRYFARHAERCAFGRSAKVYSMSTLMADYYRKKGLESEPLPHGVDPSLAKGYVPRPCGSKPKVGFAGLVYETNASAVVDLVEAKRFLKGGIEIHIATPERSKGFLGRLGVLGDIDRVATFPSQAELLDFLSGCDMLYVPMSFEPSMYRGDLLTIFPTKVTDYWLAGRPVLVYGPEEYAFVAKARDEGYAMVVSQKGPEHLAAAISELCSSKSLRAAIAEKVRGKISEHDSGAIASRLMKDLGVGR
jgi:glycosyltransferase involved in cell wall biosynthesis